MKEKNVPTTNNTEPQRPVYPAVRKPAKGPSLTTSSVGVDRDVEDMSKGRSVAVPAKRGRKPRK